MTEAEFASVFKKLTRGKELTGNDPTSWQWRLFHEHFTVGNFPSVIDLPTGLGKTMVMALWLIAWAHKNSLPRRLVYVVDRRTVVDQATDLATALRDNAPAALPGIANLAVSTLRGQLADNRDWTRDPSRPAIIIGTVDLIGSALLFSGYRSSYKRRPLEAGLLGQDSLLVLDEAHLSKPFEKLICAIGEGGSFQKNRDDNMPDMPMRVIRMSATSGQSGGVMPSFTLQLEKNGDLKGDDAKDSIAEARFNAKKRLTITTLGDKENLNTKLTDAAIELAQKPDFCGKRIVVFVRSPDDARVVAEKIRNHAKPAKSKSNPDSVELLTGTMRGLERDELVEKAVFKDRWLNGELDPSDPKNQEPVFLVSTSAGEVGFDLNADHLVGDAAPLDSWIQRLGRVNRRGKGMANVQVFVEPP
ncbi:MAG TPA: type I-U CRISPR-associated helicase/endonuclease Cas3, partial [Pirellulales bacterium]|nr:type I-U CRISPR-associated helicase/endonuclease Cas3 [Pirellulales bacterium]